MEAGDEQGSSVVMLTSAEQRVLEEELNICECVRVSHSVCPPNELALCHGMWTQM